MLPTAVLSGLADFGALRRTVLGLVRVIILAMSSSEPAASPLPAFESRPFDDRYRFQIAADPLEKADAEFSAPFCDCSAAHGLSPSDRNRVRFEA